MEEKLEKLEQVVLEKWGLGLEDRVKKSVFEVRKESKRALQEEELRDMYSEIEDIIKELDKFIDLDTYYAINENGSEQGYVITENDVYVGFVRLV